MIRTELVSRPVYPKRPVECTLWRPYKSEGRRDHEIAPARVCSWWKQHHRALPVPRKHLGTGPIRRDYFTR
jgi:hypothetical protein